jgi:predicted phosphodiesterase
MRRKDELEQSPRQELSATEQQFVNKAFGSELGEYQIKKRELQNKNRELNKLQRKLTDQTIFSRELIKSISKPRVIRTNRYVKDNLNTNKNDTLIVITSDWHIGAKVELKNNEYSYAIAQQRLDKYIQAICRAVQLYKPSNIKIINLGDLIENSQMRQNQGYYTEFELSNQIVKATELQDSFLSSLAISFPNIQFEFTELAGNHDRFAPNKKDQLYGDSVAVVARELTKSFKNTNKAMTNFKVINPDTEYRHIVNVQGHNLAFVHGDLDKVNDNNCLAKVGAFEHTTLDALVGGHLHSLMIKENNGLVVQSGSLIGPTEYSDRLGCYASASQVMLNVTPETITPLVVNL